MPISRILYPAPLLNKKWGWTIDIYLAPKLLLESSGTSSPTFNKSGAGYGLASR